MLFCKFVLHYLVTSGISEILAIKSAAMPTRTEMVPSFKIHHSMLNCFLYNILSDIEESVSGVSKVEKGTFNLVSDESF